MEYSLTPIRLFGALILVSLLNFGYSLKCYECDSVMKSDCHEMSNIGEKYLTDCTKDKLGMPRKNPVCFLAHGKVNLMIAEGEAVVRGCTEDTKFSEDACSDFQTPYRFAGLSCKTCKEDGCNADYVATAAPAIRIPTMPPAPKRKEKPVNAASGMVASVTFIVWAFGVLMLRNAC